MDDLLKQLENYISKEERGLTVGSRLNSKQERFACGMINLFGQEKQLVADIDTLNYFETNYVIACMERALKSNVLYEGGIRLAKEIIEKLKQNSPGEPPQRRLLSKGTD